MKRQKSFYKPQAKRMKSEKAKTNSELTRQVTQLGKKVNTISKAIESKYYDQSFAGSEFNYDTNNTLTVATFGQGDTAQTRSGQRIMPTRLDLIFQLRNSGTTASGGCTARMLVIQSKQRFTPDTTAGISTNGGVFNSANTSESPFSMLTMDNRTHYTVLLDRIVDLEEDQTGANTKPVTIRETVYPKRPIIYEPGDTGDTESGQIYILFTSDVAATAVGPVRRGNFRLYFKDA